MLVADAHLGHRDDPAVAARLADADHHRVVLSDVERIRSRVRTETEGGRDLGIVVGRDLEDGDVLETEGGDPVVVELAAVDALVVELGDADVPAVAALELGHAFGNRHWPLAIRGDEALVRVADSYERTEAAAADLLPGDVGTRREAVPPTTFDDDAPDHSHGGGDGGGHSHGHDDHEHGADGHNHGADGHSHGHHDGDHGDHSHDHAENGHIDHGHRHDHHHDHGQGHDHDHEHDHGADGERRSDDARAAGGEDR